MKPKGDTLNNGLVIELWFKVSAIVHCRNDYRSGSNAEGHQSGLPRPYGGQGHGPGSYSSSGGNSNSKWDSVAKDSNSDWGSFPGAKVQNSPGRQAFPAGWGSGGNGSGDGVASGSNWGHGTGGRSYNEKSGWGSGFKSRKVMVGGW
ncbi:transcription elongation factor SPT6 homolog [Ricinus communis]|uniref:transcription elongation factor SPT6 homolog n=1 Tax=Ricinus communis TaxID=3988 RepID=UPI00201B1F4C|nr:transcription elongation factor SPT6 homolog [Ricinus communis]